MSISRYDLISASVLTNSFDLRERVQEDIQTPLAESGFGSLPETSIPQTLALIIKGRTETATQMNLSPEDVENHWKRATECLKYAINFAKNNLGVERSDFLPYDAMIPVLAYYFYYAKTNSVAKTFHREQLEYWFWRVAFSERYSGASQTRMTEDASWIRTLVDSDTPTQLTISISIDDIKHSTMRSTKSAIRNGFLCLLKLLRPRHFENGEEISLSADHFSSFTSAEKHHIFPKSMLREDYGTNEIHRIPNFCFMPSDLNRRISDKAPSQYMQGLRQSIDQIDFERIMASHLIPVHEQSGIWYDNYELFLQQRAQLILEEINSRAGIIVRIEEEQRNPLIDRIEQALRDQIHTTL